MRCIFDWRHSIVFMSAVFISCIQFTLLAFEMLISRALSLCRKITMSKHFKCTFIQRSINYWRQRLVFGVDPLRWPKYSGHSISIRYLRSSFSAVSLLLENEPYTRGITVVDQIKIIIVNYMGNVLKLDDEKKSKVSPETRLKYNECEWVLCFNFSSFRLKYERFSTCKCIYLLGNC